MTGATQSGQDTSQPAGGSGAAAAAGDQSASTVLGGDAAKPGEAAKPAEGAAAAKPGEEAAKPGEGEKKPEAGKDKPGESKAPEKYADFAMPEGIELDAQLLEGALPVLKELNLSQEGAQKLVDVLANRQAVQAKEFAEQLKDESFALDQAGAILGQQRDTWGKALKDDAEIGGKNFDTNVQTAQRAIARFGSPALKDALNKTGLGNHPEFVRFCLKVGHLVQEDSTTLGSGAAKGARKPTEEVFYAKDKAG